MFTRHTGCGRVAKGTGSTHRFLRWRRGTGRHRRSRYRAPRSQDAGVQVPRSRNPRQPGSLRQSCKVEGSGVEVIYLPYVSQPSQSHVSAQSGRFGCADRRDNARGTAIVSRGANPPPAHWEDTHRKTEAELRPTELARLGCADKRDNARGTATVRRGTNPITRSGKICTRRKTEAESGPTESARPSYPIPRQTRSLSSEAKPSRGRCSGPGPGPTVPAGRW